MYITRLVRLIEIEKLIRSDQGQITIFDLIKVRQEKVSALPLHTVFVIIVAVQSSPHQAPIAGWCRCCCLMPCQRQVDSQHCEQQRTHCVSHTYYQGSIVAAEWSSSACFACRSTQPSEQLLRLASAQPQSRQWQPAGAALAGSWGGQPGGALTPMPCSLGGRMRAHLQVLQALLGTRLSFLTAWSSLW